jgi:hypothetical protein
LVEEARLREMVDPTDDQRHHARGRRRVESLRFRLLLAHRPIRWATGFNQNFTDLFRSLGAIPARLTPICAGRRNASCRPCVFCLKIRRLSRFGPCVWQPDHFGTHFEPNGTILRHKPFESFWHASCFSVPGILRRKRALSTLLHPFVRIERNESSVAAKALFSHIQRAKFVRTDRLFGALVMIEWVGEVLRMLLGPSGVMAVAVWLSASLQEPEHR